MTPAHPTLNQTQAPLLDTLRAVALRSRAAFHTPGHKQGQSAPVALRELLGAEVFRADLPELPELDTLFAPEGVIQQAQELAAAAFGAEQTWFLANGSTCGIEAAVLATCNPGDKLILPRNAHQSAIAALILSGAVPIVVEPVYDATWDMAHGITPDALKTALSEHADAKAVLIVSPTYYGVGSDIATLARLTHEHHLPLLVDEAHGSHFAFHPGFPESALAAGADLAVQSIHKTLSALTQAAMLHIQGSRINRQRLSKALQLVQSTSPSYLLLASLDAARQQMALAGQEYLSQTLALATYARHEIHQISGLALFELSNAGSATAGFTLDPTRLTLDFTQLGLTGFEADTILHQILNVTAELPCRTHLTFVLSLGNTAADIETLIQACRTLAARPLSPLPPCPITPPPRPITALTPRDAFFAPAQAVPIAQAIGQVSAELICPYPPGIPLLFPGEVITAEAVAYLQQVRALGGNITGCADATLEFFRVIKA
ncbi:MAG: aminotransferase class I/II-fold pyridoxal phosphate-dependent enzyme [Synechococcales cyanobacterium M58_A2018_015]|nr:aminotransferase class I/II-fold pyridoxal phosphate-dependent enzyme [Synechococcales cyanobacterium M58_A2018_015]